MADERARLAQYDFKNNSNLVLRVDRSLVDKKPRDDATGEVIALSSKALGQMGDRALKTAPAAKSKKRLAGDGGTKNDSKKIKLSTLADELDEMADIFYRPKSPETKQIYDCLLRFVHEALGDWNMETFYCTADEILLVVKGDSVTERNKRAEVEKLVNKMSDERYAVLVNLCKKINDWNPEASERDKADEKDSGLNLQFEHDDDDDAEEPNDEEVERESDDDEDDDDDEDAVAGGVDDGETGAETRGGSNLDSADDALSRKKKELQPHDIDAFWLQRQLTKYFPDVHDAQSRAVQVLDILKEAKSSIDVENKLVELLGFEMFDLVAKFTRSRNMILYCTLLARAQDAAERSKIARVMDADPELKKILTSLEEIDYKTSGSRIDVDSNVDDQKGEERRGLTTKDVLDLEDMALAHGSHHMSNSVVELPNHSTRTSGSGFEEFYVPAPEPKPFGEEESLVPIEKLPAYVQPAFEGFQSLNRIQSRLHKAALENDDNLLLCAPTGAGKTNVALLAIMREIGKHINADGTIRTDKFKVIYVAPMRSLVQEMVGNFQKRLDSYGIKVDELTGDHQLTKEQIAATQVIVCTPEKWDIVTRKGSERAFTQLVRLVIIDEIHLLHDDRGPVLEAIVARTIRNCEIAQEDVRIVGLSATLPNYKDVALFLRVPERALFHFDNSYRPVPLVQRYIGFTEKNAAKRMQTMNSVLYDKIMDCAGRKQVMVFVHSRKSTADTARAIRDMCMEKETLGLFVKEGSASAEVLRREAEEVVDQHLKDLLPFGFGIHHAGMKRIDRRNVEDLFADRHIQVLVSTSTLAWGVNLPAHTVIIKGTQIYDPERGRWTELGPLDVMQMMGRAGRPQYDSRGEGILMTNHSEIQFYLSLMNQQLPIESQFVAKLADNLNAEVVLGTVQNVKDAVKWLGYTYLYVRMVRSPAKYHVPVDAAEQDPKLEGFRTQLVHTAATILHKNNMVRYDNKIGQFEVTELGRIASTYYVSHETMASYNARLKPTMQDVDLLRVFSASAEFKHFKVRGEEKMELSALLERVPIAIKETVEEPTAKVNVLLQVYISQLQLDGFKLMSDMIYVAQSAARLMRAIFEIVVHRGWAEVAEKALSFCKMIDKKMWECMTPLRQFAKIPEEVLKKIEKKTIPFADYLNMSPNDICQLLKLTNEKSGRIIHRHVHLLPMLKLEAHANPINRSTLRVDLTVTPSFNWDEKVHGQSEVFWIFVLDVLEENILHHEYFLLKQKYCTDEHLLKFFVPIYEPMSPYYHIKVISDKWIGNESTIALSLVDMILPNKYPPPTELLDLQPLSVEHLGNAEFESLYGKQLRVFNPIQTQVFTTLYSSSSGNVFIGAPTGSGKTVCLELAVLKMFSENPDGKCLYLAPVAALVQLVNEEWQVKFGRQLGKKVVLMSGDLTSDMKLVAKGHIVMSTPEVWDVISRGWRRRPSLHNFDLFLVDELHHLGGDRGPTLEVVVSRMRYIYDQIKKPIRIVGVGSSLSNAKDVGQWLGCSASNTFSFHPNTRPVRAEIHLQGFNVSHAASRLAAMAKPLYNAITCHSPTKPVIVFVPSRKQTRITTYDLLTLCASELKESKFLHVPVEELSPFTERIQDKAVKEAIVKGVGYLHEGLCDVDRQLIEKLFESGAIQVLIVTQTLAWSLRSHAYLVAMMDTQCYNGKVHAYEDYPVSLMLQMIGRANRPNADDDAKAVVLCHNSKKEFFKKFLSEPIPIESHLDQCLHDHFNADIASKVIGSKQEALDSLTWTFLYRRIKQNPNYYGLRGITHHEMCEHLSALVEKTLDDLERASCIAVEDDKISTQNLGIIASYYSISYSTMELFSLSLNVKVKVRGLIEIISKASEFETIPIRHHEDSVLKQMAASLPIKIQSPNFSDPHVKTHLLLQAHFSRMQLLPELMSDTEEIVSKAFKLTQACVDVCSSNGWFSSSLTAMDFTQMLTQAVWKNDSDLKQLPHFAADVIKRFNAENVKSVMDFINMDDNERDRLLQMTDRERSDVARFTNKYPNVDFSFEILDSEDLYSGSPVNLSVDVEREDEYSGPIMAPHFPQKREEGWWVVVKEVESSALVAIKRVTFQQKAKVKLDFVAPSSGRHSYGLYFVSDAYLGCDHEYGFEVDVKDEKMVDD